MKNVKFIIVILVVLFNIINTYAQLPGPSGDPGGDCVPVPLDGGILISILAGSSFLLSLVVNKKKNKKEN